ncbi:MAG TPA: amidohydrolase family protein [Candidatus Thermoplasmatota archaeon]|nr:amidohydrolase family protein [Candidatus Thermoplasmatota archaeon]
MIGGHRVLDAHVHMQPWSMLRPATREVMARGREDAGEILAMQEDPARFEALLDAEGIDAAVLVNYVSPEVMGFGPEVNGWVAAYCRARPRLVPMGSVHPRHARDPRAEVEHLVKAAGVRALKVHPAHQLLYPNAYALDVPQMRGLYEAAERLRVPVTIHTGTSVFPGAKNRFTDPIHVDDVAVDFPDLPILVAHAGRPLWGETAFFLARRHPNVYLEVSGIPPKRLLDHLPRLAEVEHKVVWGSDWPSPGVRSMRRNVEEFLALPALSDAAKGRILWETGARLFGARA